MEKIEEMIKRLCPEGVEYVKLGEVCKTITPPAKLKTNQYQSSGPYMIIDQGQDYCAGYTDNENVLLPADEYVLYGDHTCSVKYVNKRFAQGADGLKILKFKENCNTKYLYYALSNYNIQSREYKRHWLQAKEIQIPLPPLPIQEAIVEILDNFSRLSAELQAELQARKQQYAYYRNQLLTRFAPDEPVREYALGDITSVLRGKRLTKSQLDEFGKYKVYHGGLEPIGLYNEKNRDAQTVMIINVGASAGTIGYSDEDFWSSDGCFCLKHCELIDNKYLYYFLQTKENLLKSKVRHAGIPTLDSKVIEDMKIQLPSLTEQARIVSILDKFEALINDLSQGLPAEIEAVQKQYEYYRNKLLTFEPA